MESKTNIVLVHGAWADGSSWGKVIPFLQQTGFNVTAAQIPLTSLADDIVVTRNLLAAQKGPTVLAGHSYAGVVISGAANDAPNVKALVYIAAFGLDEGESLDALSKQGPAPAGAAAVRPPDENGFLWIDQDGFAKAFAADADPVEARVMAAVQKPLSINSFIAKIRATSLETSAVVVHGCDGRPDDSAASRGIYGKENGCHGPQSSCESCSHGLSP